jgi:hypothetical protein
MNGTNSNSSASHSTGNTVAAKRVQQTDAAFQTHAKPLSTIGPIGKATNCPSSGVGPGNISNEPVFWPRYLGEPFPNPGLLHYETRRRDIMRSRFLRELRVARRSFSALAAILLILPLLLSAMPRPAQATADYVAALTGYSICSTISMGQPAQKPTPQSPVKAACREQCARDFLL